MSGCSRRVARKMSICLISVVALSAVVMAPACAEPQALDDEAMAEVTGRDGVGFAVHLEMNSALLDGVDLNSRLTAGFNVNGLTTYAIALNVGGIIDMYAMTLDLRKRADGSDYIDLGLPFFIGIKEFGFRAFGAQTDPTAPITNSYGQLLLNGHASMQGHVYMWAQ